MSWKLVQAQVNTRVYKTKKYMMHWTSTLILSVRAVPWCNGHGIPIDCCFSSYSTKKNQHKTYVPSAIFSVFVGRFECRAFMPVHRFIRLPNLDKVIDILVAYTANKDRKKLCIIKRKILKFTGEIRVTVLWNRTGSHRYTNHCVA